MAGTQLPLYTYLEFSVMIHKTLGKTKSSIETLEIPITEEEERLTDHQKKSWLVVGIENYCLAKNLTSSN